MATLKRILLSLLVGAGAGTLLALLVAPGILEWWAKPAVPTVCSCVEQIQWALTSLRKTAATSAGIAAVLGIVGVEIVRRLRRRNPTPPA